MAETRRALTTTGLPMPNGGGHAGGKLGRTIRAHLAAMFVTTVAASARSYHDQGTARNRRYYYVIRAVNAVGPGPASSEVTALAR